MDSSHSEDYAEPEDSSRSDRTSVFGSRPPTSTMGGAKNSGISVLPIPQEFD